MQISMLRLCLSSNLTRRTRHCQIGLARLIIRMIIPKAKRLLAGDISR